MDLTDIFAIAIVLVLLVAIVGIFVRISVGLRRGGGSLTTTVLGATDEFLTKEKSKAAETIINENAGKTFEDQKTSESKQPSGTAEGDGVC